MKVLINTKNKKVVGFNRTKLPFEIEVNVDDNISLQKTIENTTYKLFDSPSYFTIDDVVEAKGKKIVTDKLARTIILNEELDELDIDTSYKKHSANTGFKFFQLNPKGQCQTTAFTIPVSTTRVNIYLEADDGITTQISKDGKTFTDFDITDFYDFGENIETVYLRFINTTNEYKEIYSYGIIL